MDRLLGESLEAYGGKSGKDASKATFSMERAGVAAMALGIVDRCLELSVAYANDREQFGQPIGQFQLIQLKLAKMEVARMNLQNLVFRHIEMTAAGVGMSFAEASAAKLYAAQAATEVALEAVQLFGGNGYMAEYEVEQLARDAKVLQIYAGTDEIQISAVARSLLADASRTDPPDSPVLLRGPGLRDLDTERSGGVPSGYVHGDDRDRTVRGPRRAARARGRRGLLPHRCADGRASGTARRCSTPRWAAPTCTSPSQRTTLSALYCTAKPIVAVAVLRLVAEDELSLDDRLGDVVDDLPATLDRGPDRRAGARPHRRAARRQHDPGADPARAQPRRRGSTRRRRPTGGGSARTGRTRSSAGGSCSAG